MSETIQTPTKTTKIKREKNWKQAKFSQAKDTRFFAEVDQLNEKEILVILSDNTSDRSMIHHYLNTYYPKVSHMSVFIESFYHRILVNKKCPYCSVYVVFHASSEKHKYEMKCRNCDQMIAINLLDNRTSIKIKKLKNLVCIGASISKQRARVVPRPFDRVQMILSHYRVGKIVVDKSVESTDQLISCISGYKFNRQSMSFAAVMAVKDDSGLVTETTVLPKLDSNTNISELAKNETVVATSTILQCNDEILFSTKDEFEQR